MTVENCSDNSNYSSHNMSKIDLSKYNIVSLDRNDYDYNNVKINSYPFVETNQIKTSYTDSLNKSQTSDQNDFDHMKN